MIPELTARDTDMDGIKRILLEQRSARKDLVVPANQLSYRDGKLVLAGQGAATLVGDGPDDMTWAPGDLVLDPTEGFERQLVAKNRLGIPWDFFNRHKVPQHVGQLDQMVNYWLSHQTRNVLIRAFEDGEGGGIARAMLSDGYGIIEHLDFLVVVIQAVAESGRPYNLRGINLSEGKMRVDISSPAVEALAPELLRGYVSPFTGQRGEDLPIVRAFIRVTNSETGWGRFRVEPGVEVQVCTNGMTMTRFAEELTVSRIHRGSRMAEGPVVISEETRRAQMEALKAETADAVRAFFDPEWFKARVAEIEGKATAPLEAGQVLTVLADVSKALAFTDAERDGILTAFIEGQQLTNGGVVQAITAHAQRVTDPERAAHLEAKALDALAIV